MTAKKDTYYVFELKNPERKALIMKTKEGACGLGFDRDPTSSFAFNSMMKADFATKREATTEEIKNELLVQLGVLKESFKKRSI